ncbi:CRISPR-associated endonuclease Cas3'' [Jiella sp. MQZ9-1]|uniref:CRISPR-associated endonuclease Cas3 n=1 Tax=Jiella flava TaxID=2816857 RepID=A0A939G2B6_9HYPH|nr:CRISPR-associated endonuclease Cas3'' [Jiella flava]MBO0664436.1 CRISPR-associated endonuclease Cas3'' [Jiella flava]MCD2473072.1 CRISPR-associated endonuclease Cas3'' [Jiella flava]
MFFAHSNRPDDVSDWEPLSDHLAGVAATAAAFGAPLGIAAAARLSGLLHDLGKFNFRFQKRLTGANERVDHSTAGAVALLDLPGSPEERAMAMLIAQAIAGHHAGLPDRSGSDEANLEQRIATFDPAVLAGDWRQVVPTDLTGLYPEFDWHVGKRKGPQLALLGRMIFSCLVDADYKETERYYDTIGGIRRDRDWPSLAACLPTFQASFADTIAAFGAPQSPITKLRAKILATVRERAVSMTPGLFTLDVPTGGGKTLASLGFALDHAAAHGHRRIIYGIPFTSIIDQTAAIFRGILGDDAVLEHHSAIEDTLPQRRDAKAADSQRSAIDKMRLAMEDWAAPVVVTTHVQLFESLFAARPSRCRKLHNIAGSVIILDEAQVLPRDLLAPSVEVIDELARNWRCSIVLCTATQPAFDARHFATDQSKARHPLALDLEGRELAPEPARLHAAFRRNTLVLAGEMDDDALIAALRGKDQALVIVNSRAHALDLYRLAEAAELDGLIHLTTRQYAAHRRRILADVRERLRTGAPCRLIATSLIEAGVDVDFPCAWRAEAGLEQIAQAAGRVNREMTRPVAESQVTVFKPVGHQTPREIKALIGDMDRMVKHHEDLFAPAAIADYFGETYWRLADDGIDGQKIMPKMSLTKGHGLDIAYREIAALYRMIETDMVPVIVSHDAAACAAVDKLARPEVSSGAISRDLQSFIVQVPPKARARLMANGHVAFGQPNLRGDQFAVLQTSSLYKEDVGLLWDDADYLAIDSLNY